MHLVPFLSDNKLFAEVASFNLLHLHLGVTALEFQQDILGVRKLVSQSYHVALFELSYI